MLAAYLAAMLGLSALSSPLHLAGAVVMLLLLAGRDAGRLLSRAILAILAFSAGVSLTWAAYSRYTLGAWPWDWLLAVNLRVLAMSLASFLFIARVNLFRALAFSRRLSFLLVLASSQATSLMRAQEDFRLAVRSRAIGHIGLHDRYLAAAHAAVWLLDRALASAHEVAQAMRARGFFGAPATRAETTPPPVGWGPYRPARSTQRGSFLAGGRVRR